MPGPEGGGLKLSLIQFFHKTHKMKKKSTHDPKLGHYRDTDKFVFIRSY